MRLWLLHEQGTYTAVVRAETAQDAARLLSEDSWAQVVLSPQEHGKHAQKLAAALLPLDPDGQAELIARTDAGCH